MRTTVTVDDLLYQNALELSDPSVDKSEIFREALKTYVRVQASRRLAALGGMASKMPDIPRSKASTAQALVD